jgi:hypothetical protein
VQVVLVLWYLLLGLEIQQVEIALLLLRRL